MRGPTVVADDADRLTEAPLWDKGQATCLPLPLRLSRVYLFFSCDGIERRENAEGPTVVGNGLSWRIKKRSPACAYRHHASHLIVTSAKRTLGNN